MSERPLPSYDDIAYEALPNDFKNLPRLPPRGRPRLFGHGKRPAGTGPPLAGEDWYEAWVEGDTTRCVR